MDAALLVMMVSFCAAMGSAAQQTVASLSERLGRSAGLLVAGVLAGTFIAMLFAAAGAWFVSQLAGAAGFALITATLFAAFILLLRQPAIPEPEEPTLSLGAVALVLIMRQITAPHALIIFASAAALASPVLAGIGGALGVTSAVALGWLAGEHLKSSQSLKPIRIATAVALLIPLYHFTLTLV